MLKLQDEARPLMAHTDLSEDGLRCHIEFKLPQSNPRELAVWVDGGVVIVEMQTSCPLGESRRYRHSLNLPGPAKHQAFLPHLEAGTLRLTLSLDERSGCPFHA